MKRHEEHEEGGGERWLVSYSDFITLLMVLFVILYSMGKTDIAKYKALADSMRSAFTMGGAAKIVDVQINQSSGAMENGKAKPIVIPGIPEAPPKSEEVAGQLTSMLSKSDLGGEVSVQTNVEGVLISLSQKLVFKQGTAELPPEALPVLDTIATMLKPVDNQIRLVGHTDDTPPTDPKYTSNWDLSVARAMVVTKYLINAGINPSRLIVSGRGEYENIFPNDSTEHRSLNGRVDMVVIYPVDSSMIGNPTVKVAP